MCLLENEVDRPEMQWVVHVLQGIDTFDVGIPANDGKKNENHNFGAFPRGEEELLGIEGEPRLTGAFKDHEAKLKLDLVEQAMEKHPAVSRARAFPRPPFIHEVFCAIVPKKESRLSESSLRLFAVDNLQTHMVPKKFFYWKKVPLNMTRLELSHSALLKEISVFTGRTEPPKISGGAR